MKKLQPYTRRQLGRIAAVSAACVPLLALMRNPAQAAKKDDPPKEKSPKEGGGGKNPCLLKGTRISTPPPPGVEGPCKSLISNVVDVRDPIQIAYDKLAKRAEAMLV